MKKDNTGSSQMSLSIRYRALYPYNQQTIFREYKSGIERFSDSIKMQMSEWNQYLKIQSGQISQRTEPVNRQHFQIHEIGNR